MTILKSTIDAYIEALRNETFTIFSIESNVCNDALSKAMDTLSEMCDNCEYFNASNCYLHKFDIDEKTRISLHAKELVYRYKLEQYLMRL